MIDQRNSLFGVNTAGVGPFELISNVYAARNWTVSINFSFHLGSTFNMIVVSDVVLHVWLNGKASCETIVIRSGWWPCAFTADINGRAFTSLKIVGYILFA